MDVRCQIPDANFTLGHLCPPGNNLRYPVG